MFMQMSDAITIGQEKTHAIPWRKWCKLPVSPLRVQSQAKHRKKENSTHGHS